MPKGEKEGKDISGCFDKSPLNCLFTMALSQPGAGLNKESFQQREFTRIELLLSRPLSHAIDNGR